MKKVKFVKGTPIYILNKRSYLYMPEKVFVSKMLYDEEAKITRVYCKQNKFIFELICINAIIFLIVFNLLFINKLSVKFRYNSLATYNDHTLYLNLLNEENSYTSVNYNVRDTAGISICSGTLAKGESLTSVDIENVDSSYTLYLTYKTFIKDITETYTIKVVNKYTEDSNDNR